MRARTRLREEAARAAKPDDAGLPALRAAQGSDCLQGRCQGLREDRRKLVSGSFWAARAAVSWRVPVWSHLLRAQVSPLRLGFLTRVVWWGTEGGVSKAGLQLLVCLFLTLCSPQEGQTQGSYLSPHSGWWGQLSAALRNFWTRQQAVEVKEEASSSLPPSGDVTSLLCAEPAGQ